MFYFLRLYAPVRGTFLRFLRFVTTHRRLFPPLLSSVTRLWATKYNQHYGNSYTRGFSFSFFFLRLDFRPNFVTNLLLSHFFRLLVSFLMVCAHCPKCKLNNFTCFYIFFSIDLKCRKGQKYSIFKPNFRFVHAEPFNRILLLL